MGCIISIYPEEENTFMENGDEMIYQVEMFLLSLSIQLYLDGDPILGKTGIAYECASQTERYGKT